MSVRSLMIRLGALATIAFMSLSAPLNADPPSGGCEEGERYCEGCNFCWAEPPTHRINTWVCDDEGNWGEPNESGYQSQGECEIGWELLNCEGDPFEN